MDSSKLFSALFVVCILTFLSASSIVAYDTSSYPPPSGPASPGTPPPTRRPPPIRSPPANTPSPPPVKPSPPPATVPPSPPPVVPSPPPVTVAPSPPPVAPSPPPVAVAPSPPPVTVAPSPPPVAPSPPPVKPSPPPATVGSCPVDTIKIGACVDLLDGLVNFKIGDPAVKQCCQVLEGLLGLDAAVCLCTTIKLKLLDHKVYFPISLKLMAVCGKIPPPSYKCT